MTLRQAVIWFSEHTFMSVDSALTHLCNAYATFYSWVLIRKYGVRINCFDIPASADRLCKTEVLALVNYLGQWKWKFKYESWACGIRRE